MRNYGEFIREDIPPEPSPEDHDTSTASVGLGDSSASGDGSIKNELDEKVASLSNADEEASEKELSAAGKIVSSLKSNSESESPIDITEEIEAINSLIGVMKMNEDKQEHDGLSMALDLSWLDE